MDYTGKIISKNPPQPTQASASGVWTLDEAAAAVKNNSWPIPGVPNPVSKSLRFNSADSAHLNRTPGSAGNRRTFTWSGWVKRSGLTSSVGLFSAGQNGSVSIDAFEFNGSDQIRLYSYSSAYLFHYITTAVYRDVSAWYHIVVAIDTTQATASNRVKLYVNGVQVTAFSTQIDPTQNSDCYWFNTVNVHALGATYTNTRFFNGYMTEVNFIDGQALTPSSFGQTNANTGVWEPKPYTGTYGGNGFYLNFKDSATTTALGYDYSGNGNNWTPNNFSVTAGAGNDSLVDVPTQWIGYNTSGDTGGIWRGNYCTMNPLKQTGATLTNGNLQFTKSGAASTLYTIHPTFFVSSGKWYFEMTPTAINSAGSLVGIVGPDVALTTYASLASMTGNIWAWRQDSYKVNNGSSSLYGNTWTANDVIGIAIDMDNGKIWWSKNGTWQASGDPAAGTNAAFTNVSGSVGPLLIDQGITATFEGSINAGQRPFAYTPPAGFLSLCTTNLPTPTIGATSTTQANDYFNTVLYTGTGSSLGVTGAGFQPDFVWIKSRSEARSHALFDVLRGATIRLYSDSNVGDQTETTTLTAFNTDGFTVSTSVAVNNSAQTYVSWNWKANGAGSSNTAGTITSTVSANADAGFSIVTYTGTGANATVGHGCKVNNVATAPSMVIVKRRSAADAWYVYHKNLTSAAYALQLNSTIAETSLPTIFNSTAPTSTLFSVGTDSAVNANTATYVAYCFAPVAGYSAFGSYTGNGSTDGPFIYTGFRPRYVLIKRSSAAGESWFIHDTARSPYNVSNLFLAANLDWADTTAAQFDIVSNGIKIRESGSGTNTNGATYIYAAFAESPFKYALAR